MSDTPKRTFDHWSALLGIGSLLVAIATFFEGRREVLDEWVGDQFGRVVVTVVFVVVASAVGFALGAWAVIRQYREGSAFWWGVSGMLLNFLAPLAFVIFVVAWA